MRRNIYSFPQYLQYISNFRSQITYSFVKCVSSSYFFLHLVILICRGTDISKYLRESLGLRDNDSRLSLRKYAYSNILKILPPKNEKKKKKKKIRKNSDIFHISAQNIDCGCSLEPPRQGGSNEYQQSMCLSRNKKNNVYPCQPQFYYKKKWGLRASKLYRHVFVMIC